MPEPERKYPCKLEGALSDNQERARKRKFEKVRLVEQHGGRTRGDARLDRGMQESILVPSSASDVGAAPADWTKEEGLVEQQGGRTYGAWLDRGMEESILVPSSPSNVSAASTDLYMAKQFEDIKINGGEVGHWWGKQQKLGMEPSKKTQVEVLPQMSSRCHWPPDYHG